MLIAPRDIVAQTMTSDRCKISSTSTTRIRSCPVPRSCVESGRLPLLLNTIYTQPCAVRAGLKAGQCTYHVLPISGNAFYISIVLFRSMIIATSFICVHQDTHLQRSASSSLCHSRTHRGVSSLTQHHTSLQSYRTSNSLRHATTI